MRTGLPATTMTGYEANACRAGVGRVAVGGVAGVADLGAAHARPGPAPQSWPGCPQTTRKAPVTGAPEIPRCKPATCGWIRFAGMRMCVTRIGTSEAGATSPGPSGRAMRRHRRPTVNGALLRPRDAHKLSYRDAPISRSSRFTGLPDRSVFGGPAGRPVQRQAHRGHNLVGQRLPLGGPQREQVADVEDDRVNKMSDLAQHR